MEAVDRDAMVRAAYRAISDLPLSPEERKAAIAATAEGYAFPTNLDTDPPVGGLAPKTQAALMAEAVDAGWSEKDFQQALDAYANKRAP